MIDMTLEDISGISNVVEDPCVLLEHKGHMDLQTQDERHDLEIEDYIHNYQFGESDSPVFGSSLIGWRDQQIDGELTSGTSLQ